MSDQNHWIHQILDGTRGRETEPDEGSARADQIREYRQSLSRLASQRERAPEHLATRIMAALPEQAGLSWWDRLFSFWPREGRWLAPALTGALATLVLAVGLFWTRTPADQMSVYFEVLAPGAHRVELVGSFNDWKPGEIVLEGPDNSGHWTATVDLPGGRHEYFFLVDGKDWMTDPSAAAYRPDGFGRENALIEL